MGNVLWHAGTAVAPWFILPATFAILTILAQRAFVVAPTKLAPKLNRISLISGVKNKFGRQGLFEFAKSFTKLLIYSTVLAVFLAGQSDRIIGTIFLEPRMVIVQLGRLVASLMLIVLLVALALGFIDFLWQRAEHIRKNRMSRKEMMDELKQSEGDPVMKQQRRQKGYDIATNKMLADVPEADVVVVNPTHFAVALKWDRKPGSAPVCVAKGVDEVAARIRELAQDHAVPIHSDPPAARAMFATVEVGQQILPEHFAPVAAAIRYAEKIKSRMWAR
jgi:flagellar biosynthetic protein FlhB